MIGDQRFLRQKVPLHRQNFLEDEESESYLPENQEMVDSDVLFIPVVIPNP